MFALSIITSIAAVKFDVNEIFFQIAPRSPPFDSCLMD